MYQNSYLYYPLINIPQSTLVHSVLFHDKIKRIVPPAHHMDKRQAQQVKTPNDISNEYLGYNFIEEADYWESKNEITPLFNGFLDEIHSTKKPELFSHLLGEGYQNNFDFNKNKRVFGTQYFVYAHKFSSKVFNKLESLGWMKYNKEMNACELSNELCNIYMTLLASSISKKTLEPISTGSKIADSYLGSSIFKVFFKDILPTPISDEQENQEVCIDLLFNNNSSKPSLENILAFSEAVHIRAELEKERKHFSNLITHFSKKVSLLNINDKEAYISLEVEEIIDEAKNYMSKIQVQAQKNIRGERKDLMKYLQTGIQVTAPIAGALADSYSNGGAPSLGFWSTGGVVLALSTLLPEQFSNDEKIEDVVSAKENAFIYMNRLWDLQS